MKVSVMPSRPRPPFPQIAENIAAKIRRTGAIRTYAAIMRLRTPKARPARVNRIVREFVTAESVREFVAANPMLREDRRQLLYYVWAHLKPEEGQ